MFYSIFAKILLNGNTEKEHRVMVAVIFRINSRPYRGYCFALGMAYLDTALSVHRLCERHGYYVIF